jgi:hypothetical protein
MEQRMQQPRRRFNQIQSSEERLTDEAVDLKKRADGMPPGVERDRLLRLARQAETGSQMSEWLPGLRPPD